MRTKSKDLRGIAGAITPGLVFKYAGSSAPAGYLVCDGSAISRSTYSSLFTQIGTTFGAGDGSTTFNLPDYRGRTGVGYAASGGHTDVSTLGNNDGLAVAYRRPKHRHTAHYHTAGGYNNQLTTDNNSGIPYSTNVSQTTGPYTSSNDGGSGNASDSLDAPAYLVLIRLIKT